MGIIGTITPGTKSTTRVPCFRANNEDIALAGQIDIVFYKHERNGLSNIQYQKLYDMKIEAPTKSGQILWKSSLLFPEPCAHGLE